MNRIKRGDIVQIICGKDKGKTGKVLRIFAEVEHATVEGINFVKKHARRTQENQKGGVIEKESPVHLSNLMIFCKQCNTAVRTKITRLADNTKNRVCVKCKGGL
jgi:large subunit ribosomal protein L24